MSIRLMSLLLVAAVTGSGCYLDRWDHGAGPDGLVGDPYGNGGNITFSWSFAGRSCAQTSVDTVVVTMPGEYLQNDGRYPCSTSSRDGITLTNFLPGNYAYAISAYDASGTLLYHSTGQLVMDGTDQFESVDLLPITGGTFRDAGSEDGGCPPGGSVDGGTFDGGGFDGGAYDAGSPDAGGFDGGGLDAGTADGGTGGSCGCGRGDGGVDGGTSVSNDVSWTFPDVPNAPTCGDELAQVVLTVDGQAFAHECGAGLFPSRVTLPTLAPGQHALKLDAVDGTGRIWASNQVSIDIPSGSSTYQIYPVPWIVGSAAIDWTFFSCDGLQTYATCAQAGVDTMAINFQDSSGNWLYADSHGYPTDDRLACNDNGLAVLRAVTPGAYTAFVAGYGTRESGILYDEFPNQSAYPVTVQAGVFLTASSPASQFVSVDLYQQ